MKFLKEKLIHPLAAQQASIELASVKLNNAKDDLMIESGLLSDEEEKRLEEEREKKEIVIHIAVAAACVLFSAGAIYIELEEAIVCLAFSIPMFIAPYTVYQRDKIQESYSLRDIVNQLRDDMNQLSCQNRLLAVENDKLEKEARRLYQIEDNLKGISSQQNQDVDEFRNLVKENKKINEEKKFVTKRKIVQQFVNAICQSDCDQDYYMDEMEIDLLVMRIKQINGLNINEDKFRKAFLADTKRSLRDMMRISRELLKDQGEDGDILNIEEQGVALNRIFSFEYCN